MYPKSNWLPFVFEAAPHWGHVVAVRSYSSDSILSARFFIRLFALDEDGSAAGAW